MTPMEHYREAERLIAVGESVAQEIREADTEERRDALGKQAMGVWAQAQVHATLAAREACPRSERVDGPWHSDRWASDGPYIECVYCGRLADALSGRTLREARP